ncbi:MAG: DMT family transporter [Rhodospirillales bacterium]
MDRHAAARADALRGSLFQGSGKDNPARAALLMIGGLFMLAFQDSIVKLTSTETSLWQFQILRAGAALVLIAVLSRILWRGAAPQTVNHKAVWLRAGFITAAMVLFFGGAPFLSLAEMAAGLYVFPLFVAVLSAVFLGERVGPKRIAAVAAGFFGAWLILDPGAENFRPVSVMPVGAGLMYALSVICTRRSCRRESPLVLVRTTAALMFAAGWAGVFAFAVIGETPWTETMPYLAGGWRPLTGFVVAAAVAAAALQATATTMLAFAYQNAESSWLAPFDYSYLVFAAMWGILIWGDVPDARTFAGMALIAAAGCFVAWRERVLRKRKETPHESG